MARFRDRLAAANPLRYTKRQWFATVFFLIFFVPVIWVSELYVPHPATLFPASSIALAFLYLGGVELWPVVYFATLLSYVVFATPFAFIILPVAQTLQAFVGAYVLRKVKIDPLFRHSRDIFWLLAVVVVVALIVPTLSSFAHYVNVIVFHINGPIASWSLRYTATVFCLLILLPFLLRWFAKPRFSRTPPEAVETVGIFTILIGIDYFLFAKGLVLLGGIPLVYFLMAPLFWIALRLRPRFVSLSLVITAAFALCGLFVHSNMLSDDVFTTQLFQIELFLILIAAIFNVITSLDEDRRLNTNLMRSQLATLENAVSRVSSESKAKNDFIAILAHELRNPLAPVVSAIDLLKLSGERSTDELETLTMMEDRMQTVRRLLDDLLDISRITEGKVGLKKEPVDLEGVLRRAIISTAHHYKERHQSLTFRPLEETLRIEGDPVRLEQIFSNLLTNASKYSDSGDQVIITIAHRDDQVEVSIIDEGVGINADVIEHIFTPFHQVELGTRTTKGLGIGLALVRNFAEMHGGAVTVTSKGGGHGSTFTVTLPLMQSSQPQAAGGKRKKFSGGNSHGLKVLIVDDNDAAAWSMGRLLELHGCNVSYGYDGQQAIERMEELSPDVILLDVGLPDRDGYSVAKSLRARGFHGRLIALTGFSTDDAKQLGKEAGFEYYLVKPAGLQDLKKVIPEIT